MVAKGRRAEWEFGTSRCKLLCTGWINKVPLWSTEKHIQYLRVNRNGKEHEKCVCVHTHTYIYITESLCCIYFNKINF